MPVKTFIVDCPKCRAKVAAELNGSAETKWSEEGDFGGQKLSVGKCPRCFTLLAGQSELVHCAGFDSYEDEWGDPVRVFPKPPKLFSSSKIPRVVTKSLSEADISLQAGAYTAACAMFGRALEAVCRDKIESSTAGSSSAPPTSGKKMMLAEGIQLLKERGIIDEKLHTWSKELHIFRNIAAHPEDVSISRQDAEDLQTFVYAIVEYIYDLTERYEEFKERLDRSK